MDSSPRQQRRVGVIQSNYIPWKGYFDIIHEVDLFIFYDDVQYTKRDWRNRNLIKTRRGADWLTIPVGSREGRLIHEVRLDDPAWAQAHWRRIVAEYGKAPYFPYYRPLFEDIYRHRIWDTLSELNQHLIRTISQECLGIRTEFRDSREFTLQGRKLARLLDLLVEASTTTYVSGPAARAYLDGDVLAASGIELEWMDYSKYPEHPQFHPPFVHEVTVLDLLFHTGPQAPDFIWGHREERRAGKSGPC